jgi:hypothetical protein
MVIKNKSFEGKNRNSWQQDSPSASPIRLINLKFKSTTNNQNISNHFNQDFSKNIEQDDKELPSAEVLLSALLPPPLLPFKKSAERELCRIFKAENASDIKMNLKDLLASFIYNKKSDKILNFLEKCCKFDPKGHFSPEIASFQLSSSFRVKQSSRQFCYPHTTQKNSQDYLRLVLNWWNEISDGKTRISALSISEFLLKKGFSLNLDECRELVDFEWQEFWEFEEFLGIFIFPIVKCALVEGEDKRNFLKIGKSFLPSYQKIKAQKQRMKFSCFSPLPIKLGYVELKNFRLKKIIALNVLK